MNEETILLDHGSGGLASQELISQLFLKHLKSPILHNLEDSAVLLCDHGKLAFTTDSYVVDPIFFPGGDIGQLAVHGTVNDLAMQGAVPRFLSLALILEEGLKVKDLEKIICSISKACDEAKVEIVTGDTKVVPNGAGDKIFINTSGIGVISENVDISHKHIKPGDAILLSGTMGDHGITIMTQRSSISVQGDLKSDTMPLHRLVAKLLEALPGKIHALRDPTRGGVATTLNELAERSGLKIALKDENLPIRAEVRAGCELLGLDPLYLANEGKCLAIVDSGVAENALQIMQASPEGKDASIIGYFETGKAGRVTVNTVVGGERIVPTLHGISLPRIC